MFARRLSKLRFFATSALVLGCAIGTRCGSAQAQLAISTIPASAAIELSSQQTVPALVPFQGTLLGHAGERVAMRFAIYATEASRQPLWSEQQTVELGAKGEYSVLLGAGSAIGLPHALFMAGEPRWLAVSLQGDSESEQRSLLTSVPYAMKSANADTLGGQPAASFVTQDQLASKLQFTAPVLVAGTIQPQVAAPPTGAGTTGYLPIWTSVTSLGTSAVFQSGSGTTAKVGIGTVKPSSLLDVSGFSTFRNNMTLVGQAATAAAGVNSPMVQLDASSFNSGTAAAVSQNFAWQVQPTGNNTGAPSSKLALLASSGTAGTKSTGLSIAPNGVITFASGQSFPSSATTFPKGATFDAESFMTGSSTDWMLVATNTSTSSKGTILGQASGTGTGIEGASPGGVGVDGLTDTGNAVYGIATSSGNAVYGGAYGTGAAGKFWSQNASGPAVMVSNVAGGTAISSTATNGYGGLFSNNSTYQATVYATNSGNGNAGSFYNNSAARVALAGVNASADAGAIGTYGNTANGKAVYGVSTSGNGVYGISSTGVAGTFSNSSDTNAALAGSTSSTATTAIGVYGSATGGSAVYGTTTGGTGVAGTATTGTGIIGISQNGGGVSGVSSSGVGVSGLSVSGVALNGHTGNNYAGYFQNQSDAPTIYALNAKSGGAGTLFQVFRGTGASGTCGIGGEGDLTCTGRIKTLATVGSGRRQVETYTMQSPENWLEDFGSGSVQGGAATVVIDPAFAETISDSPDYRVFLSPRGDSKGLFVTNVTATGFEVRESGGGKSSLAFDYRIVAKRRGMERERLVDVTDKLRAESDMAHPSDSGVSRK